MTLPTSGPLTLNNIQTEFGGSSPTSLNEYYAGGAYVPAGTSGTYGAVPSSGAISIRNFYGTSRVVGETHTLVTGNTGTVGNRQRGYVNGLIGSLTPTATTIGGATQITALYYDENTTTYFLNVNSGTNSGWTQMNIDSKVLTRASATYSSNQWQWITTDTILTQAFGANGSTHTVVFS